MQIEGKNAVVTGGAGGIGLAIVRALAESQVAGVVIADVDAEGLGRACEEIESHGITARPFVCDVSAEAEVEQLADFVDSELGGIDLVFNNAGVTAIGEPLRATEADIRWEIDVNLIGVMHGTRIFGRRLIASDTRGWICNTASQLSFGAPAPDVASYIATKHAILGYTDAMRQQYQDQIGFSLLCPGPTRTAAWDSARARPARFGGPAAGDVASRDALDTIGTPAEIVGRMAVAGVRAEDFYILTRREDLDLVRERYEEVLASVTRQFGSA